MRREIFTIFVAGLLAATSVSSAVAQGGGVRMLGDRDFEMYFASQPVSPGEKASI